MGSFFFFSFFFFGRGVSFFVDPPGRRDDRGVSGSSFGGGDGSGAGSGAGAGAGSGSGVFGVLGGSGSGVRPRARARLTSTARGDQGGWKPSSGASSGGGSAASPPSPSGFVHLASQAEKSSPDIASSQDLELPLWHRVLCSSSSHAGRLINAHACINITLLNSESPH